MPGERILRGPVFRHRAAWRAVRAPQITDVLVSFGDVGRSHCALEEERWHAMLTRIAEERGYRPTWVGCTHRQRFGSWPTGNPASIEPDAEVLSFVEAEIAAWRRRQRAERKGGKGAEARAAHLRVAMIRRGDAARGHCVSTRSSGLALVLITWVVLLAVLR
jgi:hypothetical protein